MINLTSFGSLRLTCSGYSKKSERSSFRLWNQDIFVRISEKPPPTVL